MVAFDGCSFFFLAAAERPLRGLKSALLAVLHYIWLVKGWPLEPFVYLAIIIGLLALRIRLKSRRVAA